MKYQLNYSDNFPATKDRYIRKMKAGKITRILHDFLDHDMRTLRCLDLGCSVGVITSELHKSCYLVFGIDIDESALVEANINKVQNEYYILGDALTVPVKDHSYDVIVCSQVYEHVPDPNRLAAEIYRLLKDTGICFLSGPNRWAIMEDHYNLPFLSWVPRPWANYYVKLMGRADEYYEHPLSAKQLSMAFSNFEIYDYTLHLLSDPEKFAMEKQVPNFLKHVPLWMWRIFLKWIPNFNWVLTKK
jgi:2-polyprenyl-3-methyl-5-hydroxy-6-metoxy-1,4-benzoquinol methylase